MMTVGAKLVRCGPAFSFGIALNLSLIKKNIVKTLSHTGKTPKALGVKFHFPWLNTGRGAHSQRSTEKRLMKFMSRNGERAISCGAFSSILP